MFDDMLYIKYGWKICKLERQCSFSLHCEWREICLHKLTGEENLNGLIVSYRYLVYQTDVLFLYIMLLRL